MLIFRNKLTGQIYAGSDWKFAKPRIQYADGVSQLPLFFSEGWIEAERKLRNLPERLFEAVPVALVDLRTGATITLNQKEDTKT